MVLDDAQSRFYTRGNNLTKSCALLALVCDNVARTCSHAVSDTTRTLTWPDIGVHQHTNVESIESICMILPPPVTRPYHFGWPQASSQDTFSRRERHSFGESPPVQHERTGGNGATSKYIQCVSFVHLGCWCKPRKL